MSAHKIETLLFIAAWLCHISSVAAQTGNEDLAEVIRLLPDKGSFNIKKESKPKEIDWSQNSEIKILMQGAIRGYQAFLSSQDVAACNFTPSCSRFSTEVFKRAGMIKGALLTSDRLQRCNGLPGIRRHYHMHPQTGKLSDPVDRYVKHEDSGKEIYE